MPPCHLANTFPTHLELMVLDVPNLCTDFLQLAVLSNTPLYYHSSCASSFLKGTSLHKSELVFGACFKIHSYLLRSPGLNWGFIFWSSACNIGLLGSKNLLLFSLVCLLLFLAQQGICSKVRKSALQ